MTRPQAPSGSERATAHMILGLLLAITTPFLLPAGLVAVWVGVSLVRGGHRIHGGAVLVTAVVALTATLVALAA